MHLLFGVMLDMSVTHRLNKIEPSIEPWGTPYLAVRRDNNLSLFVQNAVYALSNKIPIQKVRRKV